MPALRAGAWTRRSVIDATGFGKPFLPSDLAPDVDYDAEAITGVTDGGEASTWPEVMHGYNLTKNGTGPAWQRSAINGKPGVVFPTGVDRSMANNSVPFSPSDYNGAYTIMIVLKHTGPCGAIFKISRPGLGDIIFAGESFGFGNNWNCANINSGLNASADVTARLLTFEGVRNGLGSFRSNSGFTSFSGTTIDIPNGGGLEIGRYAGTHFPGVTIGRILYWRRGLTAWERYIAERFLCTYYTLTQTLHVPSDVANLLGWYEADGLALVDGATVDPWTDLSGTNHPLTQQVVGAKFTYWSKALAGRPAVRSDGVGRLENIFSQASPYSYGWVGQQNRAPTGTESPIGSGTPLIYVTATLSAGPTLTDESGNDFNTGAGLTVDVPYAATAIFNGASSYFSKNGARFGPGNAGGLVSTRLVIGSKSNGGFPSGHDYNAICFHGRAYSDLERLIIEDYLRRRIRV